MQLYARCKMLAVMVMMEPGNGTEQIRRPTYSKYVQVRTCTPFAIIYNISVELPSA
jgi:hypothetical protein